jgi:glycerol uptake facilitator-like aquaporin
MFGKQKAAMIVAEFMGTFVLASAVLGALMSGFAPTPIVAATAGFTLALMVLAIGPTSGAHINPAVTFGLWSIRKIETMQAVVYIAAQFLGGIVAWRLVEYITDKPLQSIASSTYDTRVLVAEVLGMIIFSFGIAAAVHRAYDKVTLSTSVGGALFVGVMIASLGSNAVLNPAVAVAVQSWSWTYAVAPLIGSVIGMNLYANLFAETAKTKKRK